MTFEEATRAAALRANTAVNDAMELYESGRVTDEDDLTGVLVGQLAAELKFAAGGLEWDASILRHRRGSAAEEKKFGADLLLHVSVDTPTEQFSKGVLVQAKSLEPGQLMSPRDHEALRTQCRKMLSVTSAAFVFDYSTRAMRCGSAIRLAGSSERELYSACAWTSYRFFLEFFRCPIGDHRITSGLVDDLPVPVALSVVARGELYPERG